MVLTTLLVCIFPLANACSHVHYYTNQPFEKGHSKNLSYAKALQSSVRSDEVMFFVAFSGGGTRAASLAYGVLETLDDIPIGPQSTLYNRNRDFHSLLDEVDTISSVSGGSFAAAYFGLYGKRIFSDFSERFLERNVGRTILYNLALPYNWFRIASPWFSRSEVAIEYYDRILFDGKKFKDFDPLIQPLIQIQATDIELGRGFSFSPDQFRLICSDLSDFPIARAVAASAAFPGVFSAITLKNYTEKCASGEREWMRQALEERDITSRQFYYARDLKNYLDEKKMPNIHLLDGGISDNLGLRGPLDATLSFGGGVEALEKLGLQETQAIIFLIVNAQTRPHKGFSLIDATPGLGEILDSTSTVMINRYNFETVAFLRDTLAKWKKDIDADRIVKKVNRPLNFYVVEVTFDSLDDDEERNYFSCLPTTLGLPKGKVREIRKVARKLLLQSKEFQRLLWDLKISLRDSESQPSGPPGPALVGKGPQSPLSQNRQTE